jgi:hypothetical protein
MSGSQLASTFGHQDGIDLGPFLTDPSQVRVDCSDVDPETGGDLPIPDSVLGKAYQRDRDASLARREFDTQPRSYRREFADNGELAVGCAHGCRPTHDVERGVVRAPGRRNVIAD